MSRRTKIILIVAILIAAALLVVFIYLLVKPQSRPWYPRVNINQNVNTGVLPTANGNVNRPAANVNTGTQLPTVDSTANGGRTLVTPVTTKPVTDARPTTDGKSVAFYDANEGKLYKMGLGGEPELLTDAIYKEATNVTFSPAADKAVLEFPDGSNILYDFKLGKQYTLPKEMENFSFSAQGDRIAFKFLGSDEYDRWYATSNPDGTQVEAIDLLGDNAEKVTIDWSPQGQIVGYWWEAKAGVKLDIKFLGMKGENLASTIAEGVGFTAQWSPDGKQMLYSVANRESDLKPELWIVTASPSDIGRRRIPLNVQTWADKCTFDSKLSAVYCAVPRSLDSGAGLARQVADDNVDDIVRIDLTSNVSQRIAIPSRADGRNTYTIEKLFVDANDQALYFVDANSHTMNKIDL